MGSFPSKEGELTLSGEVNDGRSGDTILVFASYSSPPQNRKRKLSKSLDDSGLGTSRLDTSAVDGEEFIEAVQVPSTSASWKRKKSSEGPTSIRATASDYKDGKISEQGCEIPIPTTSASCRQKPRKRKMASEGPCSSKSLASVRVDGVPEAGRGGKRIRKRRSLQENGHATPPESDGNGNYVPIKIGGKKMRLQENEFLDWHMKGKRTQRRLKRLQKKRLQKAGSATPPKTENGNCSPNGNTSPVGSEVKGEQVAENLERGHESENVPESDKDEDLLSVLMNQFGRSNFFNDDNESDTSSDDDNYDESAYGSDGLEWSDESNDIEIGDEELEIDFAGMFPPEHEDGGWA